MAKTSDDELLQSSKMTTASDFQRLYSGITTTLNKINNNTADLENLVQKLGTPEDSEPLRDRYLHLQNETKKLMQQINADLEKLPKTPVGNDLDQRKKKTLIDNLSNQYLATLTRFQKAQQTGARKERESLERARSVAYRQPDIHQSEFDGNSSSNSQVQKQVVLPMEQHVDMNALRERDEQLRQLEKNIVQVNELFTDVSRIVHEHGEIIETVGQYIDDTEKKVEVAKVQLGQAVVYQTAARRKKVCLIVTLIIVILILVLVFGLIFGLKK